MKHLTYELIATCNEWTKPNARELRLAQRRLHAAYEKYFQGLENLKPRLSAQAWNFFRFGRDENGLHDGRLLSLRIGDGLDYSADGRLPFRLNHQRTSAVVEFLNYEQSFQYTFDLRRVTRVESDLFVDEELFAKSLGDLYLLELTETRARDLQLGFLFATGATVVIKFKRLVFRRRRLKREYQPGEMYS